MTVFCTACGKPNTDEAAKCVSCGHALKATEGDGSKKKFKGTMMMGGVGAPPAPAPPPEPTPEPESDPSGAVQAGSAAAKRNLAFQKTMMGPAGGMAELLKQQEGTPEAPAESSTDVDPGPSSSGTLSQPPGGFGPPAQSSPAQGGFGPPAQSSSASGSFGGQAAQSQGSQGGFGAAPGSEPPGPPSGSFGSGSGGGSSKTKYFIFGGIGCLVLIMIACGIGFYVMYQAFQEAKTQAEAQLDQMNSLGAGVQGELARLDLNASLSTLQVICDMDRSAEGARTSFHPEVFETLRGEACKVNRATVQAFSDSANSAIAPADPALSGTTECYSFTSGGASITTCKYDGNTVITAMQGVDQVR